MSGGGTLRFDGLVALITGGGTGLGFEHARLLADRGATVVVNDLASAGGGKPLADVAVEHITADGGIALADRRDISDPEQVGELIESVLSSVGRLDIVVANAGVHLQMPFTEESPGDMSRLVASNTLGTYYLAQRAWPHIGRSGQGRMVLTASNAGLFGSIDQVVYGMSKAAIIGLVRGLALQGPASGLAVNGLCPIATTRLTRDRPAFAGVQDRFAPRHVSPVVAYLAHPACSLNGAVLSTAGGQVSRILLGRTGGICSLELTVEEVAARVDEICAPRDVYEPSSSADEFVTIKEMIAAKAQVSP